MKRIISLILVAVMAIGLTACSAASPTTGAAAETTAAAAQQSQAASDTTLRFIDVSPSPTRQTYFEMTFAKFKEETGITVTYESVPWDDAANKLTVMGTSNNLPDVMSVWAGWLGQFVPAGWVLPLDDYIKDTRDTYTLTVDKLIWGGEEERFGHVYTVPDGMMVKGVYVRKDWAEAAGFKLEDSWTYDDFFKLVETLRDPAQNHYGASYRGARGAFDPLLVYLQTQTGGRVYDDQGNILINSPEAIAAFKKWTDVYLKGYAPKEAVNWGFVEMVDNFTGGLTGTLINDSEVAVTCQANMQPEQWTVMPMPKSTVDGKIYNAVNSPYAYSISDDSKNPEASWKLIEFLTRSDNNIEYCKMNGLIPIKKDVSNDPTYGEDGPYSAFVKQLNDPALVVPTSYGAFDVTDMHQGMLHEEVQKYLLGQQSAEDALGNISTELEKRMKQYLADNPGSVVETPKTLS